MTRKSKKEIEALTIMDDVSPLDTLPKIKSMKKTSSYYKKKKKALVQIITETNNFFITPTLRIYSDKSFFGGYDKLYLEFSWFNRTLAIRIIS